MINSDRDFDDSGVNFTRKAASWDQIESTNLVDLDPELVDELLAMDMVRYSGDQSPANVEIMDPDFRVVAFIVERRARTYLVWASGFDYFRFITELVRPVKIEGPTR